MPIQKYCVEETVLLNAKKNQAADGHPTDPLPYKIKTRRGEEAHTQKKTTNKKTH